MYRTTEYRTKKVQSVIEYSSYACMFAMNWEGNEEKWGERSPIFIWPFS